MSEIEALRKEVAELRSLVRELQTLVLQGQPRYVQAPVFQPYEPQRYTPQPDPPFHVWCQSDSRELPQTLSH